jgi:hypothetical protein
MLQVLYFALSRLLDKSFLLHLHYCGLKLLYFLLKKHDQSVYFFEELLLVFDQGLSRCINYII